MLSWVWRGGYLLTHTLSGCFQPPFVLPASVMAVSFLPLDSPGDFSHCVYASMCVHTCRCRCKEVQRSEVNLRCPSPGDAHLVSSDRVSNWDLALTDLAKLANQ